MKKNLKDENENEEEKTLPNYYDTVSTRNLNLIYKNNFLQEYGILPVTQRLSFSKRIHVLESLFVWSFTH